MDLGNGSVSDNITASAAAPAATFTIVHGSTSAALTGSSALTQGNYQLLTMSLNEGGFESNTGRIYTNCVQQTSGTLNTTNNITRTVNHIGTDYSASANFYTGGLLEVMVFSKRIGFGTTGNQPNPYLLARYQPLTVVPAAPIISVPSGTLSGPTQVAIATPADCICRYTTDGSTPSSSSPLYQGPINVYYSQTIKAIAIKNGLSSSVSSATYTLDSTQWPAPNPSDTTPLQVNVQAPS
jgi:hypothetical protein